MLSFRSLKLNAIIYKGVRALPDMIQTKIVKPILDPANNTIPPLREGACMHDWSDLIDKHGPMVWSIIRRLIGNRDDASDCFQEVFSAALELSRKQKVLSWTATLRHLASVKAIDSLRRRYPVTIP
jgi:hypothetical protein